MVDALLEYEALDSEQVEKLFKGKALGTKNSGLKREKGGKATEENPEPEKADKQDLPASGKKDLGLEGTA
jgi:hypothetical protein